MLTVSACPSILLTFLLGRWQSSRDVLAVLANEEELRPAHGPQRRWKTFSWMFKMRLEMSKMCGPSHMMRIFASKLIKTMNKNKSKQELCQRHAKGQLFHKANARESAWSFFYSWLNWASLASMVPTSAMFSPVDIWWDAAYCPTQLCNNYAMLWPLMPCVSPVESFSFLGIMLTPRLRNLHVGDARRSEKCGLLVGHWGHLVGCNGPNLRKKAVYHSK